MGKTLTVGSCSHGTLRSPDLAETLAGMLRAMQHDNPKLLSELDSIASRDDDDDVDGIDSVEYASETLESALDTLQEYAPPFCYVGMHEGDGSDLGVWFMHAVFEEACRDGEVLRISDSSALDAMNAEDIAPFCYIAVVSDHGNVSLYVPRVTLGEELLTVV